MTATFDGLYRDLLDRLLVAPEVSPRGERVRELLAHQLRLDDPRDRLLSSPARAADYGFAAGELCWYLRGASDVESIAYYSRRMPRWSDDGVTLAGAYGPRLLGPGGVLGDEYLSPWRRVVCELVNDPDSRRALLPVFAADDLRRVTDGTKDAPCTASLQFLVRDGRVCLVVTMRSCDAVWGLPYDVHAFRCLQDLMAVELRQMGANVGVGWYVHQAASLHLYGRHEGLARRVVAELSFEHRTAPALTSRGAVRELLRVEDALRLGARWSSRRALGESLAERLSPGGERWLAERLLEHRARRDAEAREA